MNMLTPTGRRFPYTPWRIGTSVLLLCSALIFPAVITWAAYPQWWRHVNYEKSPLTWFSSMQLMLIAVLGFTAFVLAGRSAHVPAPAWCNRLWLVFSAAFAVLSLDERFQLHERLREGLFKPRAIGMDLPGIGPGDFLLPLYALGGLAVLCLLLPYFRSSRMSLTCLALAVTMTVVALALDVSHTAPGTDVMIFRRMQFTEEILETLAQSFFLISLNWLNWRLLERLSP